MYNNLVETQCKSEHVIAPPTGQRIIVFYAVTRSFTNILLWVCVDLYVFLKWQSAKWYYISS